MNDEVWKIIKDFHDYEVSTAGRVRRKTNASGTSAGRILKPKLTQFGYHTVILRRFGQKKNVFVHRLVAEAFLHKPEEDLVVNHIDGDKTNNNVENLEWVTQHVNIQKDFAAGRRSNRGEKNAAAILTEKIVLEMRELFSNGVRQKEIAAKYNVDVKLVHLIVRRKRWTHI